MPKKRWLRCGGKGELSTRAGGVLQQAVVWECLRAPHQLYPERCNASSEIEKGDCLWDGANTAQFVGCHLCYASNQLQRCLIWGSLATHRQALRDTTQYTQCVSVAIAGCAKHNMCGCGCGCIPVLAQLGCAAQLPRRGELALHVQQGEQVCQLQCCAAGQPWPRECHWALGSLPPPPASPLQCAGPSHSTGVIGGGDERLLLSA